LSGLGPFLTRQIVKNRTVRSKTRHLATLIDTGRKVGGLMCPFPWGSWVTI